MGAHRVYRERKNAFGKQLLTYLAAGTSNGEVRLWRVADCRPLLAEVLITKGQIVRAQGDATAAYAALGEALRLALTFGPRLMVAYALQRLADMVAARGQTQLGVQYLAAASALREQMGTPVRPVDQASLKNTRTTAR